MALNQNNQRKFDFWMVEINFDHIQPICLKYKSLHQIAEHWKIKDATLRKIVYDSNYHSKKYIDLVNHINIYAVYIS